MAVQELPIRSDIAAYSFRVDLDSVEYTLQFSWNSRMETWFFDIMTTDETPILMGQRVFVGFPVISRFKDELLPKGRLYFFDTSGANLDPGRFDMGSRVLMIYEDEAENE